MAQTITQPKGEDMGIASKIAWQRGCSTAKGYVQPAFWDQPRARRSDPETSHEAAASVEHLTVKQDAVFRCFNRPRTDCELHTEYNRRLLSQGVANYPTQSDSGLRTRRSELVRKGFLFFTGEYNTHRNGRRARIWARSSTNIPGT